MVTRGTVAVAVVFAMLLSVDSSAARPPGRPARPSPPAASPSRSVAPGSSVEPLANVDVAPRPVRWHVLPDAVALVSISPDERYWYSLARPGRYGRPWRLPTDALRQIVEAEYGKPSPQLQGHDHLWFEAQAAAGTGRDRLARVWLSSGAELLGYGGRPGRWIEHATRALLWQEAMVQLADGVYFFDRRSAHRFDGSVWTTQDLAPSGAQSASWSVESYGGAGVQCFPDADLRGMVVVCRARKPAVWRCREGKWRAIPIDSARSGASRITSAVRLGDRLHLMAGGWMDVPVDEDVDALSPRVKALVADLGSSRTADREAAMAKLGAMGQTIVPLLREESARTADAETKVRLGKLIAHLSRAARPKTPGAELPQVSAVSADAAGNLYVQGSSPPPGPGKSEPRLLIRRPDGQWREAPPEWASWLWGAARPVPGTGGDQVWVPSSFDQQLRLYDLRRMEVLCQFPHYNANDRPVVAVGSDGTAFFRHGTSVVAYRPRQPDNTIVLRPAVDVPVRGDLLCVAANGCVWADTADSGLAAWDGRKWISPPEAWLHAEAMAILPGHHGWMMTFEGTRPAREIPELVKPRYSLFNEARRYTAAEAWDLIAAHPEEFRRGFGPGLAARAGIQRERIILVTVLPTFIGEIVPWLEKESRGCGTFLDKGGNLWVLLFGELRVLSGKQWLVPCPPDELAADDTPAAKQPTAAEIHPVGDGHYVHVLWPKPFYVALESGRFRYVASPPARSLCSGPDGSLWMELREGKAGSAIWSTRRVTAVDRSQDLGQAGSPMLLDAAGCVWLVPAEAAQRGPATVRAPDGSTASVDLPGHDPKVPLFAGRAGSVFVPTCVGFQRYVAGDPAKPAVYAPVETYRLQASDGRFIGAHSTVRYSSLGCLAAILKDAPARHGKRLVLYKLPSPGSKP